MNSRERIYRAVASRLLPPASILLIWAAWEWSSRRGWLSPVIFPPPSRFLAYLVQENFSIGFGRERASIPAAIAASCFRVAVGLGLAFGFGLTMGVLLSVSWVGGKIVLPIARLLAPIAPIAWVPLSLAVFGIGNPSAIFVVFMGVASVLVIAAHAAAKGVKPGYLRVAQTLGASRGQIVLHVVLPAVLPQVFTLLRVNFFAAWMAVLAAEMVGLRDGLGATIMIGRESSNANLILIGMCLIGLTGYVIDSVLLLVQRHFLWWDGEVK